MNRPSTTAAPELTQIVLNVLGDLAFMVTDDQPVDLAPGTVWMQADVSYDGAARGSLRCWCTRGFATELAANLLGIETLDSEAQVKAEDALREFMNVLCGQLVTLWHSRAAVFNLAIPTVRECIGGPSVGAIEARHVCRLSIDGEPLICVYEAR